ncbi:biliverdin-producing heme oxygenase [Aestuariibius insulae]|uniref:biliverdin-producing heme oxygenase n=1 Tax=Aestuariibius insulae TaxID=2058287 RepID=UPI00345EA8BD
MQDCLTPPLSLRERLRRDLQDEHEALDRKISTLDLTQIHGYRAFLAIHYIALRGLQTDAPQAMLGDMIDALGTDLDAMGAPTLPTLAPLSVHTVALDYMLIGSRLGTQVLRKRWLAATDPRVTANGCYFALPAQGRAWGALTKALGAMNGSDERAAQIVADARALFLRFSTSYDRVQTSLSLPAEQISNGPYASA